MVSLQGTSCVHIAGGVEGGCQTPKVTTPFCKLLFISRLLKFCWKAHQSHSDCKSSAVKECREAVKSVNFRCFRYGHVQEALGSWLCRVTAEQT